MQSLWMVTVRSRWIWKNGNCVCRPVNCSIRIEWSFSIEILSRFYLIELLILLSLHNPSYDSIRQEFPKLYEMLRTLLTLCFQKSLSVWVDSALLFIMEAHRLATIKKTPRPSPHMISAICTTAFLSGTYLSKRGSTLNIFSSSWYCLRKLLFAFFLMHKGCQQWRLYRYIHSER